MRLRSSILPLLLFPTAVSARLIGPGPDSLIDATFAAASQPPALQRMKVSDERPCRRLRTHVGQSVHRRGGGARRRCRRRWHHVSDTPHFVCDVALRVDGTAVLVGRQASLEGGSFGAVERLHAGGGHDDDLAPEPGATSFLAPTSAGGDGYSTEFVAILIDDSRPVLLGSAADCSGEAEDLDQVITRLNSPA